MSADVEWDGRAEDAVAKVGSDVGRRGCDAGSDFRRAARVKVGSDAGRCGMRWERHKSAPTSADVEPMSGPSKN